MWGHNSNRYDLPLLNRLKSFFNPPPNTKYSISMGEFHAPKKFRIAFNLTSKAKWCGDKKMGSFIL